MEKVAAKYREVELGYWLKHAWSTYINNLTKVVIATSIVFAPSWIKFFLDFLPHSSLIYQIFWNIVGPPLTFGCAYYYLNLIRGSLASHKHFIAGFRHFAVVWLTSLLYGLIVLAGFVLFLIPGLIWSLKYGIGLVSVLDRRLSPLQALRFSAKITYGFKTKLFALYFLVIICILPQLPFYHALRSPTITWHHAFMQISFILYCLSIFVLSPLMSIAAVTAYNSLCNLNEETAVE